ncbi:UNVERIFIED_CONTAM: hypothetical protein PYX00_010325 [Menopon gallinae]|uniref:LIM and SH3 domain protein Lasp n=1 Tax=Menopon gallinae TaxID=328185 RepID=A0AAW2HEX2_9NEOP
MVKTCARCEKTVYPIEELKCLDKIWHKQCFKCQVCQMTLNMRNYKGFNKDPYCEAHIPKAKATTVAETPEFKRIAENTKIQSNVKYHADFEKAKGKFTQVADDPETLRIKANSKNISNVAYHGELEKKAVMERQRNIGENGDDSTKNSGGHQQPVRTNAQQPKTVQYEPQVNSSYPPRQSSTVIYTSDRGPVSNPPDRRIGSIQDLDPLNDFYGSLSAEHDPKASDYYSRNYSNDYHAQQQQQQQQQQTKYQQPNYSYHNAQQYNRGVSNGHQRTGQGMGYPNEYSGSLPDSQPVRQQQSRNAGRVFKALYDYTAQDTDEVSFIDGDIIINCTPIDDGWLTGVVKRTGQSGMLPANYVTPAI